MEQAITVNDKEIVVSLGFFVHKDYSIAYKELILDVFSQYYTGQQICLYAEDGENLEFSGFYNFLTYLTTQLNIPVDKVTVNTHANHANKFVCHQLAYGIFASTQRYITEHINKDVSNAKFVGALLARFNPIRFRLAYEIDKAFPDDNFMIFQPKVDSILNYCKHFSDLYTNELDWVKNKKFDTDLNSTHCDGTISWMTASESYGNIWNRFQIEIISETDALSDFWFTEKTARCLATGKPFVLLAGKGSLRTLHDMGFKTFGNIIDESYDECNTPTLRIKKLLDSLKIVYNNPNKYDILAQLHKQANDNISLYQKYLTRPNSYKPNG